MVYPAYFSRVRIIHYGSDAPGRLASGHVYYDNWKWAPPYTTVWLQVQGFNVFWPGTSK